MDVNFTDVIVLDIPPEAEMLEPFVARVLVGGTKPLPFVRPFRARFDDEPVESVTVNGSGTGFSGYLKHKPAEGARLFVQFDGHDAIDTGLTYTVDGGPIA